MKKKTYSKVNVIFLTVLLTIFVYFVFEFSAYSETPLVEIQHKKIIPIQNKISKPVESEKNAPRQSQSHPAVIKKNQLTESERAFCMLKMLSSDFKMNYLTPFFYDITKVKSLSSRSDVQEWFFAVMHSDCPEGQVSVARIHQSAAGSELIHSKNCHDITTPVESLLEFREQFNIVDYPNEGNRRNLAIMGQGYFLLNCNGEYFLSRVGAFAVDEYGHLKDAQDCFVLNSQFSGFIWGRQMTQDGRSTCFSIDRVHKECLAIIDPKKLFIRKANLITADRIHLEDISALEFALDHKASIYNHTLEKVYKGHRVGGISKKSFIQLSRDPDCSLLSQK